MKVKQHQILFFARKGLEITEFIALVKGYNFKVVATTSLSKFSKELISSATLITVIEHDQLIKTHVDVEYFYRTVQLSKAPIQLIFGLKSKLKLLEDILFSFDEIISKQHSSQEQLAIFTKYLNAVRLMVQAEDQEKRKANHQKENLKKAWLDVEEFQKKDRLISAMYLELIKYKNLLRKNYMDWKLLELPLSHKNLLNYNNSLKQNLVTTNQDWEQFYGYFVQIDPNFFKTLKKHSKALTDENLKMCAYIKMGFSNHDIASQMNILESSVKRAQTRIKKKLKLTSEQTLRKYIQHLAKK
jgi:DNA-binding CsgD family transcriptional regulator